MYFSVINRSLASKQETYNVIEVPYLVISISSHEEPTIAIPPHPNCVDKLFLKFDDVSYRTQKTLAIYDSVAFPMKKEDAIKILDFVLKYKDDVNDIIVHCEAGISRSPAVAIALSEILNGKGNPERHIQSLNGLHYANLLVRDLILQEYQERNKSVDNISKE